MKKLFLSFVIFCVFYCFIFSRVPEYSTASPIINCLQNLPAACLSRYEITMEGDRHRVWINLTNTQGLFKQILIGYVPGATNGWDQNFDALTMDANPYADFYSIDKDRKLVVQGRALPFDLSDAVPLGYRSGIEGDLTISIDHADGDLSNYNIYLEDTKIGIVHNLKSGGYTFSTLTGIFSDRFIIRYTDDKDPGKNNPEHIRKQLSVIAKDKIILVKSRTTALKKVSVFDITGKLLYSSPEIRTTEFQITAIKSGPQILVVKAVLENGHEIAQKVLF